MKRLTPEQWLQSRAPLGLTFPAPPDDVVETRWRARFDDWYIKTPCGWYWFDARANQWKSMRGEP